jgi:phenolic acid decarboxylase
VFVVVLAGALNVDALETSGGKEQAMSLEGKTLQWTFTGGPLPPASYEHTFHDDGTVVWRVLEGEGKGSSAREKRYAAAMIAEGIFVVSYLAASGYTLTVVVNENDKRVTGFASNDKEWYPLTGTLDAIR